MSIGGIHNKAPRGNHWSRNYEPLSDAVPSCRVCGIGYPEWEEVDRIYCDCHDDFVVRRCVNGCIEYHFFQVKTKGRANQQWKIDEIFSIKKTGKLDTQEKLVAIRDSIAGKLFLHPTEFGEHCREVTVLSNVHFNDEVLQVHDDLKVGKLDHHTRNGPK